MSDFNKECFEAHNKYRAIHKVPDLTLDTALCAYAQEWADELVKKSEKAEVKNEMQVRLRCIYGQNTHTFLSDNPKGQVDGKEVVDDWYAEMKQHTFGVEPKSTGTGHFTQLIWKDTKKLGVGKAKNSKGQVYVVCNYDPPGNVKGRFVSNVPNVGGK